jgi:hypothetical protein
MPDRIEPTAGAQIAADRFLGQPWRAPVRMSSRHLRLEHEHAAVDGLSQWFCLGVTPDDVRAGNL